MIRGRYGLLSQVHQELQQALCAVLHDAATVAAPTRCCSRPSVLRYMTPPFTDVRTPCRAPGATNPLASLPLPWLASAMVRSLPLPLPLLRLPGGCGGRLRREGCAATNRTRPPGTAAVGDTDEEDCGEGGEGSAKRTPRAEGPDRATPAASYARKKGGRQSHEWLQPSKIA